LKRRGRNVEESNSSDYCTAESKKADAFLKFVELTSVNVWGSNDERKKCRREAFSMVAKFGQPALFVTITPNTDNGMSIAYYSGITGLNSLFDLEYKDMPDNLLVETIGMKDYCASARLYDRIINTFLTSALGWDPVYKCSTKEGGIFGNVRSYYGMTETQGGATLHFHLLILLYGPPMTTIQYESKSKLEKEDFNNTLQLYADSIVSNTLPSRPDLVSCSICHENNAFEPLPVKSKYRLKRHSKQQRHDSVNGGLREPLLAQCRKCKSKVSAQHLIRRSLIDCRPTDWPDLSQKPSCELPVSIRPLTNTELEYRYIAETKSRVSVEEARNIINEREKKLQYKEEENSSEEPKNYIPQTFLPCTKLPMSLFDDLSRLSRNVKDNLIDQDDVFKYFSIMSPSFNDNRLPCEYSKYIISALAAVIQGYYWQPCPCLASSRRTNSSNTSRYCYPKDRNCNTKLGRKGILLESLLGHEYINSFNNIILQTFRCNHDIQIFLGGVEMSEVIYYCTNSIRSHSRKHTV